MASVHDQLSAPHSPLPATAQRATRSGREQRRPRGRLARSPVVWTLGLALLAAAARLPRLLAPAAPDEAGYLMVAARAHPGGPFLYGDLWVDRPPLLIAFYAAADALGGLGPLRAMALVSVVLLVGAAGRTGYLLSGPKGSVWAALTAAALSATPVLGSLEVDGELLAAPLVMASCALGLDAVNRATHRERGLSHRPQVLALIATAGATGSCALMFKQNFADALVFLGVLVAGRAVRRDLPLPSATLLIGGLAAGAAVPMLAAVGWATEWGSGAGGLWQALFAFRASSLHIITSQSASGPLHRALTLAGAAVGSGLALVLITFIALSGRRLLRLEPIAFAVTDMVAMAVPAISLGGSYWIHYLIELIPAATLAIGALAGRGPRVRVLAGATLTIAVASTLISVRGEHVVTRTSTAPLRSCSADSAGASLVSDWLREHAEPGDSAVTVYGGANTLLDSGLRISYPYLWSLPVRTLDPHLDLLRASLSGPQAATWVVRTLPLHSWRLDPAHQLQEELASNYRSVATVCGHQVLLRNGVSRPRRPLTVLTRSGT